MDKLKNMAYLCIPNSYYYVLFTILLFLLREEKKTDLFILIYGYSLYYPNCDAICLSIRETNANNRY